MSAASLIPPGSFDAILSLVAKHAKPRRGLAAAAGIPPMEAILEEVQLMRKGYSPGNETPVSEVPGRPGSSPEIDPLPNDVKLEDPAETQARAGAQASASEGNGSTCDAFSADDLGDGEADHNDNAPAADADNDASTQSTSRPKRSRSEQSRINGSKSRGSTSTEGKSASSQNAFKHGLYSQGILIPGEDPAVFGAFCEDFIRELKPAGTVQLTIVRRSAELAWKLKRMPMVEASILGSYDHDLSDAGGIGNLLHQLMGYDKDGVLIRLQRYETRLEKSLQACLRELRQLKVDAENDRLREQELSREREAVSDVTRVSPPVPGTVERQPVGMKQRNPSRSAGPTEYARVGNPCHEEPAACGFADQTARQEKDDSGSFRTNHPSPGDAMNAPADLKNDETSAFLSGRL